MQLTSAPTILAHTRAANIPVLRQPWIMRQSWHDLLFAHWPLPPGALAGRLPKGVELDTFDGQAWVGVVPFTMSGVRPRNVFPVAGLSRFPELNVRTYAIRDGRPGVYFFSLDAGNPIAVRLARSIFSLPYYDARFAIHSYGGAIQYEAERIHRGAPAARFIAAYEPTGPVFHTQPGSLEHWLTERYCFYTTNQRGQVLRGDIRHLPWSLQPAQASIITETVSLAAGLHLPSIPPLLHFSRRIDMLAWALEVL